MNRMAWVSIAVAALPQMADAQMGMGMMRGQGMGMMGGSALRHQYFMRFGLDPKYARLQNPLPAAPANVEAGKRLFEQDCAACHGAHGHGDGPAAKTLDPPPANLSGIGRMPMASDGYLYWTLAEGGAPVKSAMPPFGSSLSRDDIWKLVLYVRAL